MSLQRLYDLDGSFPDRLDELLRDATYVEELRKLPGPELSELLDHLDEILVRLDRTGGSSRKCLQVLRRICSSRKILPTTYELSRHLLPPSDPPIAHGGFCDAYEGVISVKVCIKRLRIAIPDSQGKAKELFCKEAVVWKNLNHPNIVPFKGVTFEPLQLVSEWMPGGELRNYVKSSPNADLLGLVHGVAQGLTYLHSRGVIHGDLKGSNIMIDESGNARITDFGLAKIIRGSHSLPSTSEGHGPTLRWTAPEIFESGKMVGEETDIYSFAMVTIEIFTGDVPFKESKSSEVVMRIIRGDRPGRPSHPAFTASLWKLTQRCWAGAAEDRPKMEDVLEELNSGKFSNTLPTISEESPGATGTPITTVPYELNPSSLPSPPPKCAGDTPISRMNGGSSLGKHSGSGSDKFSGGEEDQGTEKFGTDGTCAVGLPPPLLKRSLAPDQTKKHGMWCRAKSRILSILTCT